MRRRWSWTGLALVGGVAATAASLTACSFDSATSSSQLTGSGVDTIPVVTGYTGTMVTAGGSYGFEPSTEIAVGDLDASSAGETQRGFVTFDISALDGDSAKSASLRVYECAVMGDPFGSFGAVVVDHITPATPPAQSQYSGSTLTSDIGTIAPDANVGFRYLPVTSAVESDVAGNATYSQFRLRFSNADGNNNGVSDYVDFEMSEKGDCSGDATLAPVLIVTY
jgi:hypothetical protein